MKHEKQSHTQFSLLMTYFLLALALALVAALYLLQRRITILTNVANESGITYDHHFAMVVENAEDSPFWNMVYEGAQEQAADHSAYVELVSSAGDDSYQLADLLRMTIATQVDGIFVEPDGSEEVSQLIAQATEQGIPILTIMEDDPASRRDGYVGINSYDMGLAYAQLILKMKEQGTAVNQVSVLLRSQDSKTSSDSENIVYSSMVQALSGSDIAISPRAVNHTSSFSAEESIRDIIISDAPPDVVVCLDAAITLSAFRTVVDYNRVGQVQILGSYSSQQILAAIQKNIIQATITVDSSQLGANCVEELMELMEVGRTNDYTTVDSLVVTPENVNRYLEVDEP